MRVLLELFLKFFQIGAIAFGGGYAILPLITEVIVEDMGWLSQIEIIDVVTISQMTPGPIALNAATFVGTKVAGIIGSIVATTGIIAPQFILMLILAQFVFRDKKIDFMQKIIKGIKPGMVGLILVATLAMINSSIFNEGFSLSTLASSFDNVSFLAIFTFIVGFIMKVKNIGIINIIITSAAIGAAYCFIFI